MATLRERRRAAAERDSFSDFVQWITTQGAIFPVGLNQTYTGLQGEASELGSYARDIYKRSGVVFACMYVRQSIFAEVRFRFANVDNGKIGTLFGTPALDLLERPWPNGTTGELAARMIQDADLTGNFYCVARNGRLWRRDPTKTVIALDGDPNEDEFVSVKGYLYYPKGIAAGGQFYTYLPEEVCHWSPLPDPEAEYRGMSWLTPVLREIRSDSAATDHKIEFYGNAATPNMVVKFPPDVMTREQFEKFKEKMEAEHVGRGKRHRTLYLAPGADVDVVGKDFSQMDFSETQGRDETRICSAAGVPPVIVGVKESLAGSSLNQGNYAQARRRLADGTMRPLYRSAAAALETIVPAPQSRGASRLWFDDSHIAFFREDRADAAQIQQTKANTIKQLVDAGFQPDSVKAAVEAEDMSLLVHTGLYSVQLQPAGASDETP